MKQRAGNRTYQRFYQRFYQRSHHRFTLILIIVICLGIHTIRASGNQTADMVQIIRDKTEQKLASLIDYQVTLIEESKITSDTGISTVESKTTLIVKGDKQYMSIKTRTKGMTKTLIRVNDGRRFLVYYPLDHRVEKVELAKLPDEVERAFRENALKNSRVIGLPDGEYRMTEEVLEGKKYYRLESTATPMDKTSIRNKTVMFIDSVTFLPYRQIIEQDINDAHNADGERVITTRIVREYVNWRMNRGIPDYTFALDYPEYTRVIDVTDKIMKILGDQ